MLPNVAQGDKSSLLRRHNAGWALSSLKVAGRPTSTNVKCGKPRETRIPWLKAWPIKVNVCANFNAPNTDTVSYGREWTFYSTSAWGAEH